MDSFIMFTPAPPPVFPQPQHPQPQQTPLAHVNSVKDTSFLQGYNDCATETIRYLTQDEQLHENDPLILGLKRHLYERQKEVYLEHLMKSRCLGIQTEHLQNGMDTSDILEANRRLTEHYNEHLCCNVEEMFSQRSNVHNDQLNSVTSNAAVIHAKNTDICNTLNFPEERVRHLAGELMSLLCEEMVDDQDEDMDDNESDNDDDDGDDFRQLFDLCKEIVTKR